MLRFQRDFFSTEISTPIISRKFDHARSLNSNYKKLIIIESLFFFLKINT